ncbi:MAG: hypothetical protein JXA71_08785 [Chitinispirillaceae bacterium]|nr:hypothetical protein [Chitinispirillaceae bacterium]
MVKRLFVVLASIFAALVIFCGPDATGPDTTGIEFTLKGPDAATVSPGGTASFTIEVTNHGPDAAAVTCKKTSVVFPDAGWSASFCIGALCYPPTVDSTETDPLPVNGTLSIIVDVVAGAANGSGTVACAIQSVSNPEQRYEHTFICTSAAP